MTREVTTSSVVTKAVATIEPGTDDATSETGTFDVILSAPTLDRDGDTLQADEWALPLPDHITFDVDHAMSVAGTVGSGTPRIEDDWTLRVSGTYSSIDRAQEVRTLVNEGHIRTTSVAFLTTKAKSAGGKSTVKRELLNGAFVAVPSNREAVVLSSKGFQAVEKVGARNSAADAEQIQTAHDSLVAAGASCAGNSSDYSGDSKTVKARTHRKSILGSVEALQDRVADALEDAYSKPDPYGYGSYWGWLRGVIPNAAGDGGLCVFNSSQVLDGGDYATFQQTFTDDGAVVTLLDDATEIDIFEILSPDADAFRENSTTLEPEDTEAAKSARKPAAKSAATSDDDEVAMRGRAMALRARAAGM
jgi:hypothetical protein